mgnify:CR=1 FL=1
MFFMRASNKGERAFCLLFWLQTKNARSILEHALHGPKGESQGWLS